MIQRIQSLFLLTITILMTCFLFLPVWEKHNPHNAEYVGLTAFEFVYKEKGAIISPLDKKISVFYLASLAVLSGFIALFSVFKYKNRLTQIKLGMVNSLLMAGILGVCVYFINKGEGLFDIQNRGEFKMGFYVVGAAILLNILANRFIKRDESLVRAADRIR